MCTVSFVSSGSKIIITSNRDEQVSRPALLPDWYEMEGKKLLFPKDPKAGGTWFAADKKGNVAVLLNGAGRQYVRQAQYRKSRGLVLLDILGNDDPLRCLEDIKLADIEPFTLIVYLRHNLYQLLWDGQERQFRKLDENQNHIWSSSTLYSADEQQRRVEVFNNFLKEIPEASAGDIYALHAQKDIDASGFTINRENILKTLSITQIVLEQGSAAFNYNDLSTGKNYTETFCI